MKFAITALPSRRKTTTTQHKQQLDEEPVLDRKIDILLTDIISPTTVFFVYWFWYKITLFLIHICFLSKRSLKLTIFSTFICCLLLTYAVNLRKSNPKNGSIWSISLQFYRLKTKTDFSSDIRVNRTQELGTTQMSLFCLLLREKYVKYVIHMYTCS